MSERRLEAATWERLGELVVGDVRLLIDRALAAAERAAKAKGKPQESAVLFAVERELADLEQQLTRAQMNLIHPDDRRYGAAQSLLRTLDAPRRSTSAEALGLAANAALGKAAA